MGDTLVLAVCGARRRPWAARARMSDIGVRRFVGAMWSCMCGIGGRRLRFSIGCGWGVRLGRAQQEVDQGAEHGRPEVWSLGRSESLLGVGAQGLEASSSSDLGEKAGLKGPELILGPCRPERAQDRAEWQGGQQAAPCGRTFRSHGRRRLPRSIQAPLALSLLGRSSRCCPLWSAPRLPPDIRPPAVARRSQTTH